MTKRNRNRASSYDSSPKYTSPEDAIEEINPSFFKRLGKKASKFDWVLEPLAGVLNIVSKILT